MRILDIIRGTTVDGPGFRTAVYFAGCAHHCPGCHNPQSWDFHGGEEMTLEDVMAVVKEEDFDVTLSGGDPLYQPLAVRQIIDAVRKEGHTVWIYTGFTWEEIQASIELTEAVRGAEAIVEGPFIEALKDPSLQFRGSKNQKIVRL